MTNQDNFSERTRLQSSNDTVNNDAVNRTKNTSPTDEVAYKNGYVEGRSREQAYEEARRTRETNSAATGIVIGAVIASIVGLTIATFALLNQRQSETVPTPAASPTQPQPQASPSQTTERTTIIERAPDAPQQTEIIVPSAPSNPQPNSGSTVQPSAPSTNAPSTNAPNSTQPSVTQPQAPTTDSTGSTGSPITPSTVPQTGATDDTGSTAQ